MGKKWVYENCFVSQVVDGATLKVDIDLGMDLCRHNITVKLVDIHAPETRKLKNVIEGETKVGKLVKNLVEQLLLYDERNRWVKLVSTGYGKYGRIEAQVYFKINGNDDAPEINLNEYLVGNGFAKIYKPNQKWTKKELKNIIKKLEIG